MKKDDDDWLAVIVPRHAPHLFDQLVDEARGAPSASIWLDGRTSATNGGRTMPNQQQKAQSPQCALLPRIAPVNIPGPATGNVT